MAVKPNLSTITNTNGGGTVAPSSDSLTYEERVKRIEDKLKELREKQLAEQQEKQRIENQRQTTANRITDAYNNSTNTFNEAQQKAQNYASGWTDGAAPVDSLTKAKQEQDALARYAELYSGEVNKSLGDGVAVNLYDAAKTNAQNLNETRNAVRAQRDLYSQYNNKEDYDNDQRLYSMSSDELLKERDKYIKEHQADSADVQSEDGWFTTFIKMLSGASTPTGFTIATPERDNRNALQKTFDSVVNVSGDNPVYKQIDKYNALINAKKYSEDVQKYGVDPQSMSYNEIVDALKTSSGDKKAFLQDYYDSIGESNMQTKRASEWYASLPDDKKAEYKDAYDKANAELSSYAVATGGFHSTDDNPAEMARVLIKNGYSKEDAEFISDMYGRYINKANNDRLQRNVQAYAEQHPVLSPFVTGAAKIGTAIPSAITTISDVVGSKLSGKAIDPNSQFASINRGYETMQSASTSSEKWNEGILGVITGAADEAFGKNASKVLKSAFYSGVEDGIRNLVLLPLGMNGVSEKAIASIGALLASSDASKTEFRHNIEQGKDGAEALSRALITGLVEYGTEAIGGEWVWKNILNEGPGGFIKNLAKATAKSALAEGTEEVMGNAAQRLLNGLSWEGILEADEAYREGGNAARAETLLKNTGWYQDVKNYADQGYPIKDAIARAASDWAAEDAEAFLSAFLSAGISAGGTKAVNLANLGSSGKQIDYYTGNKLTNVIRNVNEDVATANQQIASALEKNEQPKVSREDVQKSAIDKIESYRNTLAAMLNNVTSEKFAEQNPEYSAEKGAQIKQAIDTLETVRNAVAQGDMSVLNNIVDTAEKEITARARERAENAKIQRQVKNTVSNYVNDLVMSGKRMSQIEADLKGEIDTLTAQQNLTDEQKKRLSFDQNAVAYMETEAKNDVIKRADADLARALRQAGHEGIADGVTIKWDFNWNDDYRNADYNKSTRTITLNPYARDTKALASFVIAHELTHHLRAQGNTDLITDTWEKMQSLMDVGFLSRSDLRYNLDSMRELYKQDLDRYIEAGEGREDIAALVKSGMSEQDAINKARDNYIIEEAVANFFGDAAANYVTGKSGKIYNLNGVNSFTDEQIRDINKGQKTFNIGALISNESKNSVRGILRAIGDNLRNFARKLAGKDPVTAKHFDTLADAYRDLAERVYNDQRKELGIGENEAQEAQSEARDGKNTGGAVQTVVMSENGDVATVDDVSVATNVADTIKEDPRPVDYDDVTRYSMSTVSPWTMRYLAENGEQRVAREINDFTNSMIANSLIYDYVPNGNYAYSEKGPLRPNMGYGITYDMDASCPRTFQYLGYKKKLQNIAKRPLTFNESIQLMELMKAYGQNVPCTYCYVETKRTLLAENYLNWFKYHNDVVSAETDDAARKKMYSYNANKNTISDAAEKELTKWRSGDLSYRPTAGEVWFAMQTAHNSVMNYL
ncbi:MAG: hypothetical protein II503_02035, partial [Clostridia bacterium]|nr:hypothetical protein [Clostridia bacterium]